MARTLSYTFLVWACLQSLSASSAHPKLVSGKIIAYAGPLACLNGNAYWSMIIHVRTPKDIRAPLIRVNFSLPCNESPKWLSAKPSLQRFRLVRDKNSDAVLEEFMGSVDQKTGKTTKQDPSFPIWKHLPGTEQEKLPFGKIVPSYRSVDLPLEPVL